MLLQQISALLFVQDIPFVKNTEFAIDFSEAMCYNNYSLQRYLLLCSIKCVFIIQHIIIGIRSPTADCRPPAALYERNNGCRERETVGLLPTCQSAGFMSHMAARRFILKTAAHILRDVRLFICCRDWFVV